VFALAVLVGATDIDPFVLSIVQRGVADMPLAELAAAILIAASANNLTKAAYAVGFGGLALSWRPAAALAVLALLGLVTAAVHVLY
jgi:hypothetical protein